MLATQTRGPDTRAMAQPTETMKPDPARPTGTLDALRRLGPQRGLFLLLCLATFFEGFDTKLVGLVQPVVGRAFDASVAEVGTAVGLSSLGMVFAFFVNQKADAIGRRPVFLAALATYAAFTLATALAPNLILFTLTQAIARMAMVVELSLAYVILSEEIAPEIRGRVNGLFASTAALGAALPAGLLAPLESAGVGWRGLFLIGAIPLLLLPIYLRRIPETRAYTERAASGGDAAGGASFRATATALWRSRQRGKLLRISAIWLAVNLWTGSALYFFTSHTARLGWDASDWQWLPVGTIPCGLAGYAIAGALMDRLGRRAASGIFLAAAFVTTVVCYTAANAWVIYAAFALLTGLLGIWTILTTWTLELVPTESRATALGIASSLIGRLGLVVGPAAGGVLTSLWDSSSRAVILLSSTLVLCLPLLWTLPETRGIELEEDVPA